MKNENLIDIAELESSLGLDLDTIQMLLDGFKEDAVIDLQQLRTAIDSLDYTQIKEFAHKLKGACANLRIKISADIAFDIEQNAKNCEPSFGYLEAYKRLSDAISNAAIG